MRQQMEQMQGEVNEFMEYVKRELAAWHRRLGAAAAHALVKSTSTDLVRTNPRLLPASARKEPRAKLPIRKNRSTEKNHADLPVGLGYHVACLRRCRPKTCPNCNGTGWKTFPDSDIERVTRCDCWNENVNRRLVTDARIPRRYHHCTLNDFVTYDNETLEDALTRARRLAEDFHVVSRGLFLLGDPGVGKTHLAVGAILQQVILTRGARGIFYDTRDLLKLIRGTYNNEVKTTELNVLKPVMETDLLVLDDLGAEKTSEWVEETLNLIVNTRYNERRATIFTSNYPDLPPDTNAAVIALRSHRLPHALAAARVCDFLDLEGADYRMLLPNEGTRR